VVIEFLQVVEAGSPTGVLPLGDGTPDRSRRQEVAVVLHLVTDTRCNTTASGA
jgi:hypothetical protein